MAVKDLCRSDKMLAQQTQAVIQMPGGSHTLLPQGNHKSISNSAVPSDAIENGSMIPAAPSRVDRALHFGVDCAECVHFTHWEPGGEYVKNLVVKNVVMKTQKMRYKLPQTRYFSMNFPETVTLSAGMSWTIPITFRPVAKESYTDTIEFTTSFGKFNLVVKATLPDHVLTFPNTINFELCPIKETAKTQFILRNDGELPSHFDWQLHEPFSISPKTGSLTPGSSVTMTVEFKPQDASVFTALGVCSYGAKTGQSKSTLTKAINVYGIGKYSHLSTAGNKTTFDFGEVFVGNMSEIRFSLENHSSVHANFKIKQTEGDADPFFSFSTTGGVIPSQSSLEIVITYTPVASGLYSTEYFDIGTVSGNTIHITCTGRGTGPAVSLNTQLVNFNDVPAESVTMRALYIQNHSETTAFYQFLVEPNSVFHFDKPSGSIGPQSSVALTIKFSPLEPINYYRRLYCLVEHQDALYVDLLGTCYTDKRRPATFKPHHIERYIQRVQNGLWMYGPEQLEEMLKTGTVVCYDSVLSFAEKHQETQTLALDSAYETSKIACEYFYENMLPTQAVSLVDTYVDFGAVSRYKMVDSEIIRVTNNTKGKMSCVWIMPGEATKEESAFAVTPRVTDILPQSTFEFRIHFRPKTDNAFYGVQLECYVFFKSMRNFRLVNELTFTPPWCLTPTIVGNTFSAGEDTFIPKVSFSSIRLDFPSCYPDKSVYRTLRLTNTGDTPAKFLFIDPDKGGENDPKPTSGSIVLAQHQQLRGIGGATPLASFGGAPFSVKPRVGVLHKDETQLIVLRFSPSEQRLYDQVLKCAFNKAPSNTVDLHVRGLGYLPQLVFENSNTLCFKPTCIGTLAHKEFKARNNSRIYLDFQWRIPKFYVNLVSIFPASGRLAPNATIVMRCTFAPSAAKDWVLKIPCHYVHQDDSSASAITDHEVSHRRTSLTVIGEGIMGRIVSIPPVLEFGPTLVNAVTEREITLWNQSECDMEYYLEVYRVKTEPQLREENEDLLFDKTLRQASILEANIERSECTEIVHMRDTSLNCSTIHKDVEVLVPNSVKDQESGLEITQTSSILAARSYQKLRVRVRLRQQMEYRFKIRYLLPTQHLDDHLASHLRKHEQERRFDLCEISALGVYPSVQVTDIRCEGLSKSQLWEMFSLQRFNAVLLSFKPELTSSTKTSSMLKHGTDTKSVDFDFGACAVGCDPTVMHMNVHNGGVVPVEWVFNFPNDLEIEIEQWADPGDYTEEQLHHSMIMDNNLFQVTPKTGCLFPGESAHVVMTYTHDFPGLHRLPVTFRLKDGYGSMNMGKDFLITFVGYSVSLGRKHLHFLRGVHEFQEVHIGTTSPPIQLYQLTNRGTVTLNYHLDLSPLQKIKEENSSFSVFECLRSCGTISPGQVEYIPWVFWPLEVRQYEVDIPITVSDGKTKIITFRGAGVQKFGSDIHPYGLLEDPIPSSQVIRMPRQVGYLSKERLNFGHIPVCALTRQILVLCNESDDVSLSFKWILDNSWEPQALKISPLRGTLLPGESRICKVAFYPSKTPQFYFSDIICEITNESEKELYEAQKAVAEIARRGRGRPISGGRVVQSASESNRTGRSVRRTRSPTERSQLSRGQMSPSPQNFRALSQGKMSQGCDNSRKHELRNAKFRPLPPITPPKSKHVSLPERPEAASAAEERLFTTSRPASAMSVASTSLISVIEPPQPFLLHLSISSWTHHVDEMLEHDEFDKFFIFRVNRDPKLGKDVPPNPDINPKPPNVLHEETSRMKLPTDLGNTLKELLSGYIDEIMLEKEVQGLTDNTTQRFKEETEIPYFAQFTTKPKNGIFKESGKTRPKTPQHVALTGNACVASYNRPIQFAQRLVELEQEEATINRLLRAGEVQNILEAALESTIFNLMQECNAGEFDITKYGIRIIPTLPSPDV
ncbi:hypothetical protein BJ742DRAFT_377453 [Cladochytrium replicatum]|nr:hypothetical protein BJ742DRAFT_377453 [Cladochytrium replicatum]